MAACPRLPERSHPLDGALRLTSTVPIKCLHHEVQQSHNIILSRALSIKPGKEIPFQGVAGNVLTSLLEPALGEWANFQVGVGLFWNLSIASPVLLELAGVIKGLHVGRRRRGRAQARHAPQQQRCRLQYRHLQ